MLINSIMIVIFFTVLISVGVYSRKHASGVSSFVLGGRSIGPWFSAIGYGTAYFSAVVFVGFAGQFGWRYGISAVWIGLGNAFIGATLGWVVLGRRTRAMTQHLKSATMPEYFFSRYDSINLKKLAAIIVFIFMIPYSASIFNGLSRLFSMAFAIDFRVCIIIMAAIACIYVVVGGYMATVINDAIQGSIMLLGVAMIIFAVLGTYGGFTGAMQSLANVQLSPVDDVVAQPLLAAPGIFTSMFGPEPINLAGVVILTSLGVWGLPQMLQKFYVIKNEKVIMPGTIMSTAFCIIVAGGCYFVGGFARLTAGAVETRPDGSVIFDSIIPAMVSTFPTLLIGLIIIVVLAASISTLAACIMSSSATITLNLVKGHVIKEMSPKSQVTTIRIFVAIFVILSTVVAVLQYTYNFAFIAQLMGVSWGAMSGALLAPFLYGLYWRKTTKAAVFVNMIFAPLFMVVNFLSQPAIGVFPQTIFPVLLRSPINAGAFTMLFGLVLVPVLSLLTRAPDKDYVDNCFSCYENKGTVTD